MKQRLFTPGPTAVPEDVTLAMAQPLPHHRTVEFRHRMLRATQLLQRIYRTQDPVLLLNSSGTGAMEAAVVNLTQPGERVVAVNSGKFGERWVQLLRTFGRDVHELQVPWGQPVTPEQLHAAVDAVGATAACVTHSETSTAVLCDLQQIAHVARERGVFLLVDAITSLGAHRLETDEWKLGCVVGGSQKAFMMPPGLAFLSLSAAARQRMQHNPTPRYYFDLERALKAAAKGETPWTPAISLVLGLERACERIVEEGIEAVWERHRHVGDAVRAGVQAMGLQCIAARPSNAVTAALFPEHVEADDVRQTLWQRFAIKVAGGQDALAGKAIRLGHLGAYDAADVLLLLSAFEYAAREHGLRVAPGSACAAAAPFLAQLCAPPSPAERP